MEMTVNIAMNEIYSLKLYKQRRYQSIEYTTSFLSKWRHMLKCYQMFTLNQNDSPCAHDVSVDTIKSTS